MKKLSFLILSALLLAGLIQPKIFGDRAALLGLTVASGTGYLSYLAYNDPNNIPLVCGTLFLGLAFPYITQAVARSSGEPDANDYGVFGASLICNGVAACAGIYCASRTWTLEDFTYLLFIKYRNHTPISYTKS